jgi:hypothetical protein
MRVATQRPAGAEVIRPRLTFRQAAIGRQVLLYLLVGTYAALVLVPILIVLSASLDPPPVCHG